MRLLRTIAVTFAQYSRIPMPRFEWKEEDMKYSMAVFPWVGAVIGLVYVCVYGLGLRTGMPNTAVCLLMTAVPVIITGGFHVDGFMDVSDAISSFRTREEKLRILKDPHIGAFAVIRLCVCGLIYIASLAIVLDSDAAMIYIYTLGISFFLARGLSAIGVLTLRSAKNEGMLFYEASCAGQGRNSNLVMCCIWIGLAAALMIFIHPAAGITETAAALLSYGWYRYKSYKEFGGITGDTAGWFVTVCETAVTAACAVTVLAVSGI